MHENYYDYKELREAAIKEDTKEARLALLNWFELNGDLYWNGECYDMDDGLRLFPVLEEDPECEGQFVAVDAEIR